MRNIYIVAIFLIAFGNSHAQEYHLESPDGFLVANISIGTSAGVELANQNEKLLTLDGIDLVASTGLLNGMKVRTSSKGSVNQTVVPVHKGKKVPAILKITMN